MAANCSDVYLGWMCLVSVDKIVVAVAIRATGFLLKPTWILLAVSTATFFWAPNASAYGTQSASFFTVHYLPGPQSLSSQRSIRGKNVRVHATHALYASGIRSSITAYAIDVFSVVGNWVSAQPIVLPDSLEKSLEKKGGRVQAFGTNTGWILAPRHWVLWHALIAVNGSALYEFVAPSGPKEGWEILNMCSPGFGNCNLEAVLGLLPEASFGTNQELIRSELGKLPKHVLFKPEPVSIKHPYPCAALVQYSQNRMTVQGAVYLNESSDWNAATLYIGLPTGDSKLGRYITTTFLKLRAQLFPYNCAAAGSHG